MEEIKWNMSGVWTIWNYVAMYEAQGKTETANYLAAMRMFKKFF
jgi:hypothetical protein